MEEQIRLFLNLPKAETAAFYAAAEAAFEEEGWPIATFDLEDKGDFEISLYVPEEKEKEALRRLTALLPAGHEHAEIKREILPHIDWVKHSLEGLKPVRAGRFFVHGAHDRDKILPGEIGIEIEANRAFGTGHHGTTAGCLIMLEKLIKAENPAAILDIGTGSGILAIACAKLGKTHILASDNDPVAVGIAAENCALNGVAQAVETLCADGFAAAEIAARAPFDLIIANILAGPLMAMAGDMAKSLAKDGSLILSGILAGQREAVLAAYAAQGLAECETLPLEGWVTLHLRHKA